MKIGRLVFLSSKKGKITAFYADVFYTINLPFLPLMIWIARKRTKGTSK